MTVGPDRPRRALVTGATSGIGLAVARDLAARGYEVLGTSRDPGAVPDSGRAPGVRLLPLDLADDASILACAEAAGAVDVLVNNAGESQSGPLEELPPEALQRLMQLNVLGPVRLTQLLLPGMRERGHGRIVMIGSMLASFPVAYRSSYCASKAALAGFVASARPEATPFGVEMTLVEPGSINTGISTRRTKYIASDSVYRREFETVIGALDAKEARGISAEKVAATVRRAVEDARPRPFYAVGSAAPLVFPLRRVAPRTALERLVNRQFGLRR